MKRPDRITVILLFSAAVLTILEITRPAFTDNPLRNEMIRTILSRTAGGALFFFLIRKSGGRVFGVTEHRRALVCLLPAAAVAVNNFPLIGLFTGAAVIDAGIPDVFLLVLQSASVGLFEELTFRGFLFPNILHLCRGRSAVLPSILSSAVFAAVHLVNLFSGMSPAAVLLQTGYSFLIGGMCAVVLMKTRCVWFCVFLHAIYNLGGTLVPTLGHGTVWDPVTVTVTAVLGIAVLLYMLYLLKTVTESERSAILPPA